MGKGLDAPRDDRCSARLKNQPGKFCSSYPMLNGRCRMHGGATSPPGPTHPNFKHGKRSAWTKAMGKYGALYDDARESEELFDLRRQIAVMDVAVQRHAARTEQLDTPDFRKRALELYREARDSDDPDVAARTLRELGQLLGRGVSEDAAFDALIKTADTMSRRIEAAYGIKLRSDEVVNQAELARVIGALVNIMAEEVPKDVAARVIARADRELFAGSLEATAPGAVGTGTGDEPVAREVPGTGVGVREGGAGQPAPADG